MKHGSRYTLVLPAGDGPIATLQVRFTLSGKSVKKGTGIKVPRSAWDPDQQKVTARSKQLSVEEAAAINLRISQMMVNLTNQHTLKALKGEPIMVHQVDFILKRGFKVREALPVFQLRDAFGEYVAALRHMGSEQTTLNSYMNTGKLLFKYNKDLDCETFDAKALGEFITHFQNKGRKNSYVNLIITHLKTVLRWSFDNDRTKAQHFEKFRKVKVIRNQEVLWLSKEEIKRIADLEVDGVYAEARDAFLLQCWTGIRYSDIPRVRLASVRGSSLHLTTQKTGDALRIPLRPEAMRLIQQYPNGVPMAGQHCVYLDRIRVVAFQAGITDPVYSITIKGGKRIEAQKPKCQAIGTHSARRSFIGNALRDGMNPTDLIRVTGHKDVRTLMIYVSADMEDVEAKFHRIYGSPEE